MMVASLAKTRSNTDADRHALAAAKEALGALQQQLTEAIDEDAMAYDHVVAAYKLPKGSEAETAARTAAVQQALRAASDVPLGIMRLSAGALKLAETAAERGNRSAASDVGVAAVLLRAGFDGARLNVEINLGGVKDAAYVEAARAEVARLADQVFRDAEHVDALLGV